MDWVLGFLSGSIYGIALLAAPIYGIFWLLRRFCPRSPHPGIPTGIAVLLAFLTFPSLPRYSFEAKALENIEQAKHMKLVSTSNWGSLTEPLTLIKTPIGFFRLVGPATGPGEIYDRKQPRNMFISVILRYGEDKQLVERADADCSDRTVWYSAPDASGAFRYQTNKAKRMNDEDHKIFCETDFSEQWEFIQRQ